MRQRFKRVGENIRTIRHTRNLSQEDLSCTSGLHRTFIGSVERGERNVSLGNLLRIADALGVKVVDLLRNV